MSHPSKSITLTWAVLYVLSGICQPLLMTVCHAAGLTNRKAQLYMFFYYLGPALLVVTLIRDTTLPSWKTILKACGIASLDMFAQTLNYTGNALAGPTVFAIVYSSVTIWTAVYSRLLLSRTLTYAQWMAVWVVFAGLCLTATNSLQLGSNVARGTELVVMGSSLHGIAYVLSEAVMTQHSEESLSVRQFTAIQGSSSCFLLGIWQCIYTIPNWEAALGGSLQEAGTSGLHASLLLITFALTNLVHSVTFSHTVKYYPGGATSAGVMKGLQAVLVFVASHWLYCGRVGGSEMCFTPTKLVSLLTVSGGVVWFGILTEREHQLSQGSKEGYTRIDNSEDGQETVVSEAEQEEVLAKV